MRRLRNLLPSTTMVARQYHTTTTIQYSPISSPSSSNNIKNTFTQNPKQALTLFFNAPNTFDATFLIGRREVSCSDAFKIYKSVETKQSIQVISEMVLNCHRNREQQLCDKLFTDTFLPLLNSYSGEQFKTLKEYSWNRIFACLLIFKQKDNVTRFYSNMRTHCPNIKLNDGNQRQLLNCFSQFGELELALELLEIIENPTLIDYTVVIKLLSSNGRISEALSLLNKMENRNIYSDTVVFVSLLKSCIDNTLQKDGLQLIDMINERRLLTSDILNTTIVNFYFHFGMVQFALKFFKENPSIDPVTCGCMIQGLAKYGHLGESIKMLQSMIEQKVDPDHITFTFLIKKCEENKMVKEGKMLHNIISEGRIEHVSIYNSLINFYAQCEEIEEALNIFKHMKSHNTASWNSILQALVSNRRMEEATVFYHRMKIASIPDSITFVILLKGCANMGNVQFGEELHKDCAKYGLLGDRQVMTSLIVFYSKCGNLKKTLELFGAIKSNNNSTIIAWNAVIQLMIAQQQIDKALDLMKELPNYNLEPDAIFYSTILRACADNSKFQEGLAIHNQIAQKWNQDEMLQNSLLYFYGKKGDVSTCWTIFSTMKEKTLLNLQTYSNMISILIEKKQIDQAFSIFNDLIQTIEPDNILFSIMIKGCAEHSKFKEGEYLHSLIIKYGCEIDATLATSLVYFYYKANNKELAFQLFNKFKRCKKSTTLMWNTITQILLSDGRLDDAMDHFHQYTKFEIEPDNVTFTILLNACTEKHELGKGKIIHNWIKTNSSIDGSDVMLDRTLINFYSKCGELEMAKSLFQHVRENKQVNSYIFNAMIFAYAEHGRANDCFTVLSEMIGANIEPTPETFTALLTACSHSNLHAKALSIYNSMESVFNIRPSDIHKSCLVDALSRAGCLEEALTIIGESKEKVLWVTLMGACRKHNNIQIAEKVFDILIDIDPQDGSFYALMYNIYVFNGETQKANTIRELMKQNNATKTVGITSVYIGDEIHSFTSDDKKHPDNEQIQKELDLLISELIEAGYKPDTRWVTRIESLTEEQKYKLLCRHSEKIAMAYAFVRMPGTRKITLFKNLRVCGDCHEATKYISKVRKCEIIVRDQSRYHHFENGKCSCGDTW